jgi:hypothetical protein
LVFDDHADVREVEGNEIARAGQVDADQGATAGLAHRRDFQHLAHQPAAAGGGWAARPANEQGCAVGAFAGPNEKPRSS